MVDNELKKVGKLFQSAKARIIVIAVVVVIVIAAIFLIWHYHEKTNAFKSAALVSGSPHIQSIPGAGNPSNTYVKSQNVQNAMQAKAARKKATSFVPTITRQSFVGSPQSFEENALKEEVFPPKKLECPIKKVVYMYKPNPANCTVANLKLARNAGVTAEELLCQSCSCRALRLSGYAAGELKDVGYSALDLRQCGYELEQLIAAGFSVGDLKVAGFTGTQLRAAGFTAGQLSAALFTPDQLKAAGFTGAQLKAAGINVTKTNCNVAVLKKARNEGATAMQLRKEGCGLAALKAAGFSVKALKDSGFTAAQLKAAGFSARALKAAGFTPAQIKAAELSSKSCSVKELKKERMEGVSATQLKNKGCGLAALKAAGYTAAELKEAGFRAAELKAAGFTAQQLRLAGFRAAQLKAAGFNAKQLRAAGYSAADLKRAGFSAAALKIAGFSAKALKAAGFNAKQLRAAGFSAKQLKNAGFSTVALKVAGFNAGELKAAGFSAKQLKNAGFTAKQLHDAGYSAVALKAAGYTAQQLKKVGYTKGDLLRGGYTAKQAGYNMTKPPAVNEQTTRDNTPSMNAENGASHMQGSAAIPSIGNNSPGARLRAIQKLQQEELSQQQQRDMMQQMQGEMSLQAQKLMAEWSNNSTQAYAESIQTPSGGVVSGRGEKEGSAKPTGPVIKAGTIMFAVLDTGINSDEKSPILATIVTGELKGSKLIGNFTRVDKKVLIKFSVVNVPHFTHTFSVNAVAIDPNTARTAVAGYVNNHYLLRYGTLFASAFLSGLSQGILQSGATQDCFFGICHTTYQNLSPAEYVALGMGNVGTQYASTMSKNFNTPPTIKIASGAGIGVLFMTDMTVPQPLLKQNS